ncbi:E3 ubiquitin-protein ligase PRT6 isoform X2 [Amaranthus tricolor]|uniref:E3 ubiquitin-protein ligase PRT6 isoform X2 n=1 Tax=Amaranthus tricolor TaxID=29722 RepID=UPI00258B1F20|nr:E3 ubiquitin-protein ligase PRT6 isoform X2 [Amaranthus tricolor]
MDIDSTPSTFYVRDRILQRLTIVGVPEEYIEDLHPGVVGEGKFGFKRTRAHNDLKDVFSESLLWIKWLMFEQEPTIALRNLANLNVGQRGVCGAIWGKNDLAFRCRTCEHDPTCAICVSCFENGNHKNHDYSIIYTGGGCCDCGDETAWKREGFCSKHKGAEQMQPLPVEIANSVGPVLDLLLKYWKGKLLVAENTLKGGSSNKHDTDLRKVANEFSYVVVDLLIDFCNNSESLLSFASKRLLDIVDLLNVLVRAERFLTSETTKKLHELLLKLLGEPTFKYEFAKAFIDYYPVPVAEVLRTSSESVLRKYPLLSMFSVQIFTVPTLTHLLVKEQHLLAVLLDCLEEIMISCCVDNGQIQFIKWVAVYDLCIRVTQDIKFILSHSAIAIYATHKQTDIVTAWLRILALVQGMNPQKRETNIHVEEEQESSHLPFLMCNSIASIHVLLLKGAFSASGSEKVDEEASREIERQDTDEQYCPRLAKVGRLSEESSICGSVVHSSVSECASQESGGNLDFVVSTSVLKLIFELTKAINGWLVESNVVSHDPKLLAFKEASLRVKDGLCISGSSDGSITENSHKGRGNHGSDEFQAQFLGHAIPMDTGEVEKDASIMETETSSERDVLFLLGFSDWPDIDYDVSSQEVSVHMPLHGLLSLIMKDLLKYYYGKSMLTDKGGNVYLNLASDDHVNFFLKVLRGCHPNGFSSFMMEHPLQSRVFCSQVRAGMWKKNGDAPIICFDLYRSNRWSDHELELDLFLLQLCAAFAPADLFIKRILERFQLSNYFDLDLKRSSEYEPILMQDLLTLIIQIVKERRFCGLTESQSLQRELILKLASGDATHSQILKSLPKDLSKLDQLQDVLVKVAQYSKPSGMNQGKYSLRMPYWKELDLYHPCWTPRDLQVAEERYFRFCGVSALGAQLPKWDKVYQPLIGIARVATCKTIIQVIRAVLFYAVFTDKSAESRAPDGVLITALHLLSLALDICNLERKSGHLSPQKGICSQLLGIAAEEIEVGWHGESGRQSLLSLLILLLRLQRKDNTGSFTEAGNFNITSLVEILLKNFAELDINCMTKLQKMAPEVVNYTADGTVNFNPVSDTEKRKMKARERQAAILAKMKAQQTKFLSTVKSSADSVSDDSSFGKEEHTSNVPQDSEETHVCCLCHDPNSRNPVSFLILLQKSRIVTFVDRGPPSWDQGSQSDGLKSSVLACMETDPPARDASATSVEKLSSSQLAQLVEGAMNEFAAQAQPAELNGFIDYIKSQFPELRKLNVPGKSSEKRDKCVFSLESLEQDVFFSIQKEMSCFHDSDIMCDDKKVPFEEDGARSSYPVSLLLGKYIASLVKESKDPSQNRNLPRVERPAILFPYDEVGPMYYDGIYLSSCGHAVHQGCLDRYLSSNKERLIGRMVYEDGRIVDPSEGEFTCPVCRRLANSTLPAVPDDSSNLWEKPTDSSIFSAQSSSSLNAPKEENGSLKIKYAVSILRSSASVVSRSQTLKALPVHRNRRIRANLEPVFQSLSEMYFPGKDLFLKSGRVSPSVLMWATLKYSLVSIEIAARSGKCSLSARKGLHSLSEEFKSSGGFILPLLLKIVQSTRRKTVPDLLLRFRGLQIFSASICSGITSDQGHMGASNGEGNIVRLLKHTNGETMFPDMKFWYQASRPVLICDPFSTLMWTLFYLPCPFLSSTESFVPLVHIFYGITVIQAIITYCTYSNCNISDLGFHDSLVADIAKLAGKSAITKQFFISNYIDPSCHLKDVIDKLSLPYLRRCLLLWKLLKCPSSSPFPSRIGDFDKSLEISEYFEANNSVDHMDEVNELKNLFGIPRLDIVLKDGELRCMMLKWFHHFSKEFENQCIQRVLHLTPVVPFQLMSLPILYQDLVQRYIKARCPSCGVMPEDPALCLLCGRLCSPVWKPCCSESGCHSHAMSCGAGTGVFLLIRKTIIFLQRNSRQARWPSPYLDAFGEEDVEMLRGKPLYLNEERYAALTYMVASHGLDLNSRVRPNAVGTFIWV